MKVKNGDIWKAKGAFERLVQEKFPVMVSYKLAKLITALNPQLQVIDDCRIGLINKYGEENENKVLEVRQDGPNWGKFTEEYEELMEQEFTLATEKVKLPQSVSSTCDQCKHNMDKPFEIEPAVLVALDSFVEVNS